MGEAARKQEDWDQYTDLAVGEILRRTRIHYGQSLDYVSSILRIRANQLEAIERGDHEKLPGRVYAIGFVRAYSEYLGLDGDKIVHLFKVQSVGGRRKPVLNIPVPATESQVPNLYVIAASLGGVFLLIALWAIFSAPTADRTEIPSVPPEVIASVQKPALTVTETNPLSGNGIFFIPLPTNQSLLTNTVSLTPAQGVEIRINDSAWVEIRNEEGSAVLRRVLKAGDVYKVPTDQTGWMLSTGNAGGLTILVNGQTLAPLGEPGQVRRNISMNPADLLKNIESNP